MWIILNLECNCDHFGSKGNSCDKTGCTCKDGYEGPQCNLCITGRYMSNSGECKCKYWYLLKYLSDHVNWERF